MRFNQQELVLIGRGEFTHAYRVKDSDVVYLFTRTDNTIPENNTTKEIYTWLQDYTHIPYMQKVSMEMYIAALRGYFNVYESRLYAPLTTAYPIAWQQAKILRTVYEKHRAAHIRTYRHDTDRLKQTAHEITYNMLQEIEPLIDPVLFEAVNGLYQWASNYDSNFFMQFNTRNLKVDSFGNLVLLDVIYFR